MTTCHLIVQQTLRRARLAYVGVAAVVVSLVVLIVDVVAGRDLGGPTGVFVGTLLSTVGLAVADHKRQRSND